MASAESAASIIVPTFREADNIESLVRRTFAALAEAGLEAEMIVVDDDSRDGTQELVQELGTRFPVRILVRQDERGLSSAVLAGFREARFDRFVVMDADLQHPPELVPRLIERLLRGDCDFVIGSRYAAGGEIAGTWSRTRLWGSRLATLLARPLASVSDPLSGFFALHRETWQRAQNLNPVGFKIALELIVKGGCRRPAEVPIRFAERTAGASKLGTKVMLAYLNQLSRLYAFRHPRMLFALGAAMGTLILLLVAWALYRT